MIFFQTDYFYELEDKYVIENHQITTHTTGNNFLAPFQLITKSPHTPTSPTDKIEPHIKHYILDKPRRKSIEKEIKNSVFDKDLETCLDIIDNLNKIVIKTTSSITDKLIASSASAGSKIRSWVP